MALSFVLKKFETPFKEAYRKLKSVCTLGKVGFESMLS